MRGLVLLLSVLMTGPALAGQGLYCSDAADLVALDLPLGGGVGFQPLAAELRHGNRLWATDPAAIAGDISTLDVETIAVSQASSAGSVIVVDLADADQTRMVAELRLFVTHEEGYEPVIAGTLRVVGSGAWAVSCWGG